MSIGRVGIIGGTLVTGGLGAMSPVPAGSTNGTLLGPFPAGAIGARLYLPAGTSVTFTITNAQPVSAPTSVFTASGSSTGPNWDEGLVGGMSIYVTATVGAPLFRWY